MNDRIEKQIELAAPVSRVWRALTDHHEFGEWFRVRLEAPFAPGRESPGHITYPGYEHIRWRSVVQEMVPERLRSEEPRVGKEWCSTCRYGWSADTDKKKTQK